MFFKQDPQIKVQARLRRICDLTSPNLPRADEFRGDSRQNRCIPVLLAPWLKKQADAEQATTALTKDISDRGLSVTLSQPFTGEQVAIGFWLPKAYEQPFFLLGEPRQTVPLGGGFWALGIETVRLLSDSEVETLRGLTVERLEVAEMPDVSIAPG